MQARKSTKSTKTQNTQKRNKAKAKSANKRRKIFKNAIKKYLTGKNNLFNYLRFCAFCSLKEQRIEKKQ